MTIYIFFCSLLLSSRICIIENTQRSVVRILIYSSSIDGRSEFFSSSSSNYFLVLCAYNLCNFSSILSPVHELTYSFSSICFSFFFSMSVFFCPNLEIPVCVCVCGIKSEPRNLNFKKKPNVNKNHVFARK